MRRHHPTASRGAPLNAVDFTSQPPGTVTENRASRTGDES